MPATVIQYCAWTDVQARLSQVGASLRVDDDTAAPAWQNDILNSAAVEVNGYAQLMYDPATALANSNWVKYVTRDIAVFLACTRRGNPAPKGIQDRYDDVIKALEKVQLGTLTIPDAAQIKAQAPVLSNQIVRPWPVSEVKTVPQNSTGTPQNYPQFTDLWNQIDYSI